MWHTKGSRHCEAGEESVGRMKDREHGGYRDGIGCVEKINKEWTDTWELLQTQPLKKSRCQQGEELETESI